MIPIILKSKVAIPEVSKDAVLRSKLWDVLDVEAPLTLVVAPAGYGKTTTVSQWAYRRQTDITWYSLDEHDNDLAGFLTYLMYALSVIHPPIADDSTSVSPELIVSWLNTLRESTRSIGLVLDNYHHIHNPEVHNIVTFFLKNPIPQLRLILLSHAMPDLPIARLRPKQQLTEIDMAQLRFDETATRDFFRAKLGIQLSSPQLQEVIRRTEGWVGSLQLLALRLQACSNMDHGISDFSGNDRFVEDYLISEFWETYSPEAQAFLMQTSILQNMNGDLCDAVMGECGSHQQLRYLEANGALLIPMDTTGQCYRYHPLLVDFLQAQLEQREGQVITTLHQRACDWYAEAHEIEASLYHARLVSQDVLLERLEQFGTHLLKQGRDLIIRDYLWDVPYETLYDYPALLICYLWTIYSSGKVQQARDFLAQAEVHLPKYLEGDVIALRAQLSVVDNNPQKSRQLTEQALSMLRDDDVIMRGLMQHNLARLAFFFDGEMERVIRLLTESIQIYEQASHVALFAVGLDFLIAVRQRHGSLLEAEALCRYSMASCERFSRADLSGTFYSQLGKILYEKNRLDEAETILRQGRDISRENGGVNSFLAGSLTLARIVEPTEAKTIIDDARQFVGTSAYQLSRLSAFPTSHLAEHGWLSPWIDWRKADYDKATDTITTHNLYTSLNLARTFTLGLNPQPRKAISLLLLLESLTAQINQKSSLLEVLILLAVNYEVVSNRDSALNYLRRALILSQQTGHQRMFLDAGPVGLRLLDGLAYGGERNIYALRLLNPEAYLPTSTRPTPLPDPLTRREIDILRLIGDGYSNPEISQQVNISVSTTRWHVKNIYRKLSVNNRTRATVRAHELGLI